MINERHIASKRRGSEAEAIAALEGGEVWPMGFRLNEEET